MNRTEVVNYLNNCLTRPGNINTMDIAWLCTVISNETGKNFTVEEVTRATKANPNKMTGFLEAMWSFLVAKYGVNVHTTTNVLGNMFMDNSAVKIIKYD